MSEKSLKPRIRFKGFAEDWEQRKFLDCTTKIIDFRGRTPKKMGDDWSDTGILALSALNVKDGYIDKELDAHFGSIELYNKWMHGNELHKGQVLLTTEAPAGNVAQIPDDSKYILSQRTIAFEFDTKEFDETYIATLLRSSLVTKFIDNSSSGGTAKGISQKTLSELSIIFSRNLEEQNRIGTIFSDLNLLITLHQRKYEKLKQIKQSLLEKMFPADGDKTPKIRFKSYNEDWEQRKCSDISNRYDNLRVPVAEAKRIPGSTPYYGANGIQDYVDGYTHNGEFVLVAEDGANDLKNYPVQYVNGQIWVNNHAHVLQSNETNSTMFLKYLINSADIESVLVGGGRAKLNANVLMDLEFAVPKKNEQSKISTLLNSVDTVIILHQRKCEKLKEIKKSLLEKMFV